MVIHNGIISLICNVSLLHYLLKLYKEQYLLKKRLHDHLRNACIVAPYFGHDSSIYPPFARRPGWVPPFMVGGDYDRLPGTSSCINYPVL